MATDFRFSETTPAKMVKRTYDVVGQVGLVLAFFVTMPIWLPFIMSQRGKALSANVDQALVAVAGETYRLDLDKGMWAWGNDHPDVSLRLTVEILDRFATNDIKDAIRENRLTPQDRQKIIDRMAEFDPSLNKNTYGLPFTVYHVQGTTRKVVFHQNAWQVQLHLPWTEHNPLTTIKTNRGFIEHSPEITWNDWLTAPPKTEHFGRFSYYWHPGVEFDHGRYGTSQDPAKTAGMKVVHGAMVNMAPCKDWDNGGSYEYVQAKAAVNYRIYNALVSRIAVLRDFTAKYKMGIKTDLTNPGMIADQFGAKYIEIYDSVKFSGTPVVQLQTYVPSSMEDLWLGFGEKIEKMNWDSNDKYDYSTPLLIGISIKNPEGYVGGHTMATIKYGAWNTLIFGANPSYSDAQEDYAEWIDDVWLSPQMTVKILVSGGVPEGVAKEYAAKEDLKKLRVGKNKDDYPVELLRYRVNRTYFDHRPFWK